MDTNPCQFRLGLIFYAMTATFALLAAYSATDGLGHQKYIVGPMLWGAILLGVSLARVKQRTD